MTRSNSAAVENSFLFLVVGQLEKIVAICFNKMNGKQFAGQASRSFVS